MECQELLEKEQRTKQEKFSLAQIMLYQHLEKQCKGPQGHLRHRTMKGQYIYMSNSYSVTFYTFQHVYALSDYPYLFEVQVLGVAMSCICY